MPSLDLRNGVKRVVIGYFDPVTSVHTRRLHELASGARSLGVVIAEPPNPLLTREARAELLAALSVVHQVSFGDVPDGIEVVDERPADLDRRQNLMRQIHGKQVAGKG